MPSRTYPELHWTPELITRYWDWQSQYPEEYFTFNFGAKIAQSLEPYLASRERVLDFGCGVGHLLPHLCAPSRRVYGADTSPESIARTNERLVGTPSFEGAFLVSELRKRGEQFDAIVVVEVIEHLYDDGLDGIVGDITSMLSSDGIVIFTTPNKEDRSRSMIFCPPTGEIFHRYQHVRSWDAESLSQWLHSKGLTPQEIFATNFAVRGGRFPLGVLKRLAKRFLFGDPGTPHLVGVAKRA